VYVGFYQLVSFWGLYVGEMCLFFLHHTSILNCLLSW